MSVKFTVAVFEAARRVRDGVPAAVACQEAAAAHGLKPQQAQVLRQRVAAQVVAAARPRSGYRMDT